MAVSTMWIRDNMLCTSDRYERQLTEAELKVQESLQKLYIPAWYQNKPSNLPKILSNVTSIESQPTCSKNVENKTAKFSATYTLPRSEESKFRMSNTGTYKITRHPKSPETKCRKSPSKYRTKLISKSPSKSPSKSSLKNKSLDPTVPNLKCSKNISKTFPKVSPMRKIENINIVFPSNPKIDISELEDDAITEETKYATFVLKKRPENEKQMKETRIASPLNPQRNHVLSATPKKFRNNYLQSEGLYAPFGTPNVKSDFKVRAFSTPKCTPTNLFSSGIIENTPKTETSESFLEHSSRIERQLSQSVLESPVTTTPKSKNLSQSFLEDSTTRSNLFFERNIRSIDPIIFEKDDSPRPASSVREMVKNLNKKDAEQKNNIRSKNHALILEKQSTNSRKLVLDLKSNPDTQSPCTRFPNATEKSTEPENMVQSKKPGRRGFVQGIIDELNEKCKYSCKRVETLPNQSFVKKVVNAVEKGHLSQLDEVLHPKPDDDDLDNQLDTKSSEMSLTDSDSDRVRSPINTEKSGFDSTILDSLKGSPADEEDSVYWIPVSRCMLPRTSSLLSMMSRLSTQGQSPCESPIRSDGEDSQGGWGATFTTNVAKKLFPIDEIVVVDSGYSDRSSSVCESVDETVSGQDDSGCVSRSETLRRRGTIFISRSTLV